MYRLKSKKKLLFLDCKIEDVLEFEKKFQNQ